MSELIFLVEAAPDGGWVARGLGEGAMPAVIRLHIASERTLANRMAEVLGKPEFGRGGTSNWLEIEAACDAA